MSAFFIDIKFYFCIYRSKNITKLGKWKDEMIDNLENI